MSMSDPIADMLTRIRNAGKAKLSSVDIPGGYIKTEIAKVLKEEGYIRNYKFIKDNKQGVLRVYLKYDETNKTAILTLSRISKPSRRIYQKYRDIKPVLNGTGVAIMSTSKGVITDKAAISQKIGGEIICKVW